MEDILNITNGDSAANIMKKAGLPGGFLPWRDVLHDGPVPENLSLNELSNVRARFLASLGWGNLLTISDDFKERNELLESFENYSKVILWFEHDLYDQLQILQILDWFSANPSNKTQLFIICTEQYLGSTTAQQMKDLLKHITPVTNEHLLLAKKAWAAFRAPSPESWFSLLSEDTSKLEFLEGAILRLLEEYPSNSNGLSRTANIALSLIDEGETNPAKLFGLYIKTEERVFMGDASFWVILNQLLATSPPLIQLSSAKQLSLPPEADQKLSITTTGKDVLTGNKNWLDIIDIDHWIGGVKLTSQNLWLWDNEASKLIHSN